MQVLTVNAGSSSVRLAAFAHGPEGLRAGGEQRHENGAASAAEMLAAFVGRHRLGRPHCIAHRVVHGGVRLTAPRRVDAGVEAEIERLAPLAPLHNPAALAWMRACRATWGEQVPQVAVFDTAFFANLPPVAAAYALPRDISTAHGLRRYGFHGLAHQALWSRWCALRPDLARGGRLVSFQLGAGCSVSAIAGGRALDTSMGFSPLEGLVMATRCGDLDPALVSHLQRHAGLGAEGVDRLLNEQSGLLGLSGCSGDMRVLRQRADDASRLAVALYAYRARKYLGAYLAVLGGADGVVFGGGVGENDPAVRAGILAGLDWAGLRIDAEANAAAIGDERCISAPGSPVQAWVIPVDEARVLAQEALAAVPA